MKLKMYWRRQMLIAYACVVAIIIIIFFAIKPKGNTSEFYPELPTLAIVNRSDSFGFEGYMAYDIGELSNGNPWTEAAKLETLPVFRNPTVYDDKGILVKGHSVNDMMQIAISIGSAMDLNTDFVSSNTIVEYIGWENSTLVTTDESEQLPDGVPYRALTDCDGMKFEVEADGSFRILFENGVVLPDKYSFTHYDLTEQQAAATGQYLVEEYKDIIGMEVAELALFWHYNIDGQKKCDLKAYEKSDGLTEEILNYNFNVAQFVPNNDGTLSMITCETHDLSQKLGDYPIITVKKAREQLLEKKYLTTAPTELPDAKYIAHVDLIYRTGSYEEIFMPYYRFWVELTDMRLDNGLKNFGTYYVPAVDERYLNNMPLWDGRFD